MLRKLFRALKYLTLSSQNEQKGIVQARNKHKSETIPASITVVKVKLQQTFSECSDFVLREIALGEKSQVRIIIAFLDGMVNKQFVNTDILRPLMIESRIASLDRKLNKKTIINILMENLLNSCELKEIIDLNQTMEAILSGDTVIYVDGKEIALRAGTRGWERRAVAEPETEAVVRGPREGFSETLRTNTSLLRRKIKNSKLKFESLKLGEQTNTDTCISYIKGIADEELIEMVRRRLSEIKTDAILETGYIEEFIEDAPFSIFPTVGNTEKPDVVAGKLLEGRVAIFCDGTPFVLTVPYLFVESIQASEDYYSRSLFSSLVRLLRILALLITVTFPAIYVALISFHQTVIPFKLLMTMAAAREGVPFSPFFEALLMGIVFELLREAGVRMPRPVGQAVSIVGALVLGESAVKAGLVSTPMVIVVALTAISSFIIPNLSGTLPFLRVFMLIAANILGFMGMALALGVLVIYLCTVRSFGVPYMSPFSPISVLDFKDALIRVPIWAMITRPSVLSRGNRDKNRFRMQKNIRKKVELP